MCLICIDIKAGKLTASEGWRNLRELYVTLDEEHQEEVVALLHNASRKEYMDNKTQVGGPIQLDFFLDEYEPYVFMLGEE